MMEILTLTNFWKHLDCAKTPLYKTASSNLESEHTAHVLYDIIIYMKTFLNSDWLRALQF